VTGYVFEASSRPEDIKPAEAPKALLVRLGAVKARGRRPGSSRWSDLDDVDQIEDPSDAETVRLLIDPYGASRIARMHDSTTGVWRPQKTTGTPSAIVGYIAPGVMKMWSDHWPGFKSGDVCDAGTLRRKAGLTPSQIEVRDAVAFPPGYRLWQPGDEIVPAPELAAAAYHGLIGDFLRHIAGRVEAHPAAIGAHLIPAFGTLYGRHIAYVAGPDVQYPKLYFAVVGPTSSGGKGAAMNVAMYWINRVSPGFLAKHSIAGIGSGETLIFEMRDTGDDENPVETRRVVLDAELSRVLRVVRREGSILGDVLRTAFDAWPLRHSTRKDKVTVSTDHHLSVVGSITPAELSALTEELAILNGFANRYLYVWSEIPLLLPFGGAIDETTVVGLATRFHDAWKQVTARPSMNGTRPFLIAADSRDRWEEFYRERRKGVGDSEAMRAVTSRQVAHAARVSLVYAAADGATVIGRDHLEAGIGWADYSLGTIRKVFTSGPSGKPGQLLAAIREAGGDGLDGVGQDEVFGKNLRAGVLAVMRQELEEQHLVFTVSVPTGGRPRILSYAIAPEKAT
jgi:hypothetical protein